MQSSVATATVVPRKKQDIPKGGASEAPIEDDHDHFFWTYTEEPHRTRRQAIIKAHPEVFCKFISYYGQPTYIMS